MLGFTKQIIGIGVPLYQEATVMLQLTFTSTTGPTGKFVKVTKTITLTAETKRQVYYYYNESKYHFRDFYLKLKNFRSMYIILFKSATTVKI